MPRTWFHTTRIRILTIAAGILLAALGVIAWTTVPAWPVLGAVVAVVAMVVNRGAVKLSEATCLGCGRDIAELPSGEHGVICPDCGTITQVGHEA